MVRCASLSLATLSLSPSLSLSLYSDLEAKYPHRDDGPANRFAETRRHRRAPGRAPGGFRKRARAWSASKKENQAKRAKSLLPSEDSFAPVTAVVQRTEKGPVAVCLFEREIFENQHMATRNLLS